MGPGAMGGAGGGTGGSGGGNGGHGGEGAATRRGPQSAQSAPSGQLIVPMPLMQEDDVPCPGVWAPGPPSLQMPLLFQLT